MTQEDEIGLYKELDTLRRAHRTLEERIEAASQQRPRDELSIIRCKKEKLAIRDKIHEIEETLYPDIIA